LVLLAAGTVSSAEPTAASADEVRSAVAKALPLLKKGAEGHVAQRTCFACHNQALPILALTTARDRGFAFRDDDLKKQMEFIAGFLEKNRDDYRQGKGQGGQADTAGYALLTLKMGEWKPDATTAAVVEYLLLRDKDTDHWRSSGNRPPSEGSEVTTTAVALRALRDWGTSAQKDAITKRIDAVRGWLLKTSAKDTEDRVSRLWGLQAAGASVADVRKAAGELTQSQRKDGGWSQTDTLDSDAYATGSALVVLHQIGGMKTSDPVYQRGIAFLMKSQREDGSWLVHSRSKPFQTYFESGFPHGKDQFISIAASGWAATALALALPAVKKDESPRPGRYVEVSYPPSDKPGELQLGVTYTAWIPDGVTKLHGVIVHQHGCGSGACKGGETAAYDLHWQALARKWDCALLGPSYHQDDKQNCRLWCDPRNGSAKTFLKALHDLGVKSGHTELESVPWCLWGHSGGGFWASLMQTQYPERIVAIWFRSGTAFSTWEKGEITKPDIPDAMYRIPMMCNPGAKEKGDKRFDGAWTGTLAMFQAYRAKGAPIGFAPDPKTAHECGDSRYLAIPFFDACLEMRLPDREAREQKLKSVDMKQAWYANLLGDWAKAADAFGENTKEAVWLPNERVARAWAEYVKKGVVIDKTPPPAPFHVKTATKRDEGIEITWDAVADFESGLQAFVIQRDGKDLAQVPEKPVGKFGRPLFQSMSFHDTPEKPLPEMRFIDKTAKAGEKHEYRVIAVNGATLRSEPSQAATSR
jgi:hypothetical protein